MIHKSTHAAMDNASDIGPAREANSQVVPSLIKWSGSKRSQALKIRQFIPPHERYFEPFLGGGALLYLCAKPLSVASDAYRPLIELWRLVQSSPGLVADSYRSNWQALRTDLPEHYYEVRRNFNASQDPLDLCFLLRTCVNGIVRFNNSGEFNNSFHLSRPGMHPDRFESVVFRWSSIVADTNFLCCDYSEAVAEATARDFVYLDPPYMGTKQRYLDAFDQNRFLDELERLNRRGVRWALSFDGRRAGVELAKPLPRALFKRRLLLGSGNSPVHRVLNGPIHHVEESLYLNYQP